MTGRDCGIDDRLPIHTHTVCERRGCTDWSLVTGGVTACHETGFRYRTPTTRTGRKRDTRRERASSSHPPPESLAQKAFSLSFRADIPVVSSSSSFSSIISSPVANECCIKRRREKHFSPLIPSLIFPSSPSHPILRLLSFFSRLRG